MLAPVGGLRRRRRRWADNSRRVRGGVDVGLGAGVGLVREMEGAEEDDEEEDWGGYGQAVAEADAGVSWGAWVDDLAAAAARAAAEREGRNGTAR